VAQEPPAASDGADDAPEQGGGSSRRGTTREQRRRLAELGSQLPHLPAVGVPDDAALAEPVDDAELDARAEAGRREDAQRLVDALVAAGLEEDDAQSAVEQDRVPLALAARVLGEEARYTRGDLAAASGLDVDTIAELDRATEAADRRRQRGR